MRDGYDGVESGGMVMMGHGVAGWMDGVERVVGWMRVVLWDGCEWVVSGGMDVSG